MCPLKLFNLCVKGVNEYKILRIEYMYIYIYMGTNCLWSTVEAVWTGPMAQWPNPRMLIEPRMVNQGNNGNDVEGRDESYLWWSQVFLRWKVTSETFIRGGLKPSYPSEYYFKMTLWWEVGYRIRDEGEG